MWFLSFFFNPSIFLISTIVIFFVFLFSYFIYFSPLAEKIQRSNASPWMTVPYPIAIFAAMLLVPKIALLLMSIYFVVILPVVIEFDRFRIVPFFTGLCLFFVGIYLFIFDQSFNFTGHLAIFLWLSFCFVSFAVLEYFFTQEVYNQRDEIQKLKDLSGSLALERDKLGFVISTMQDPVIVLDPEEHIVVFNQAAEEISGLPTQDALGKKIDAVLKFAYHGSPFKFSSLVNTVQNPASLTLTKGRDETEVAPFLKEVILPDTGAKQFVLTLRNLSKEKEIEKIRLNFVTIAAHELRTPITYIRGYLSFLLGAPAKKLTAEEQSFLEKAFVGTNNLSSLIENLLTVSNIETKSLAFHKTSQDWVKIVKTSAEKYKTIASWKKVEIVTHFAKDLPLVKVDEFKISEVLENLLANSIEYSHEGSKVEISVKVEDKKVITSIKDSGVGIPAEKLPELFTEFFRLSGPLIQASKGAGLGLFISKYIVENHGGEIWVDSKLGRGSTFSFSLPSTAER